MATQREDIILFKTLMQQMASTLPFAKATTTGLILLNFKSRLISSRRIPIAFLVIIGISILFLNRMEVIKSFLRQLKIRDIYHVKKLVLKKYLPTNCELKLALICSGMS